MAQLAFKIIILFSYLTWSVRFLANNLRFGFKLDDLLIMLWSLVRVCQALIRFETISMMMLLVLCRLVIDILILVYKTFLFPLFVILWSSWCYFLFLNCSRVCQSSHSCNQVFNSMLSISICYFNCHLLWEVRLRWLLSIYRTAQMRLLLWVIWFSFFILSCYFLCKVTFSTFSYIH